MDGHHRGTWLLVPFGLIYLLPESLMAMGTGGSAVSWIALALVTAGSTLAALRRGQLTLRGWVVQAFILIDAAITFVLIVALLSALS